MPAKHNSVVSRIVAALTTVAISAVLPLASNAANFLQLPDGAKVDLATKCPVCGMIIGGKDGQGVIVTYKDGRAVGFAGAAAAVFKDGHVVGFEGARCLFIYNSVPEKYEIKVADIAHQYVTDFVTKRMIDLPKAFLVLGSAVKGPMGYDLIPFSSKDEAAKFASENDGKWIVQLHEVTRVPPKEASETETDRLSGAPGKQEKRSPGLTPKPDTSQPQDSDPHRAGTHPVEPPVQPISPPPRKGGGC